MNETPASPPAAWHPDPTARHQYRYWDGAIWTDFVADNGVQHTDPLHPPTPPPQNAATPGVAKSHHETATARTPSSHDRTRPYYMLIGADGYAGTEVAGGFARMAGLHKALGRKPRANEELVQDGVIATLLPEPRNKFDANAVMVQVNGQHVGYLEREDAARYQPILTEVIEHGYAPATKARIWASARPDWDNRRKLRYVANIRLALNPPHLIVPLNDPPHENYGIIPWGSALQVTGEEQHQNVLADYINHEGDGVVIGTLRAIRGGTVRAPKDVIEVHIDGERVGQLTPASSQHFLPTVAHLAQQSMTAAAWLRVKGSAIATQVTLQATKAHELPTGWFTEPATVSRLRAAPSQPLNRTGY